MLCVWEHLGARQRMPPQEGGACRGCHGSARMEQGRVRVAPHAACMRLVASTQSCMRLVASTQSFGAHELTGSVPRGRASHDATVLVIDDMPSIGDVARAVSIATKLGLVREVRLWAENRVSCLSVWCMRACKSGAGRAVHICAEVRALLGLRCPRFPLQCMARPGCWCNRET